MSINKGEVVERDGLLLVQNVDKRQ